MSLSSQCVFPVTAGFRGILYIATGQTEKSDDMMFLKKQPSPHSIKELSGEHLRAADRLIRLKRYDEALLEIESAQRIDPENMYTRSFLERTRYLMEKEQERQSQTFGQSQGFGQSDMTTERRLEEISLLFTAVENFITEKKYPKALNELAKVFQIDPKNYYAQAFSERIISLMRAETAARKSGASPPPPSAPAGPEVPPPAPSTPPVKEEDSILPENSSAPIEAQIDEQRRIPDIPATIKEIVPLTEAVPKNSAPPLPTLAPPIDEDHREPASMPAAASVHENDGRRSVSIPAIPPLYNEQQEEVRRFALYRELLKECWTDGVITREESDMLHRARIQYGISFDTHCQIELDIKIEAYIDALQIVWRDGVVTDNEQEVLEIMRRKFGITKDEQSIAEAKFSALRKAQQTRAMILIVDSDYNNAICVARALISRGYDVKIERNPDGALRSMEDQIPDLILSEAAFPTPGTDGFDFFQRTRLDERTGRIPFVMMTSSDDGRVLRAGLRMGVDYVIPKPLHIGYLISVVEGKFKAGLKKNGTGLEKILLSKKIAHILRDMHL